MDFGVLAQFNPWWAKKGVPKAFLGANERPLLGQMKQYISKRFIVLVYGLRRVGKTTAFYQLINHLLESGNAPTKVLYFSFDEKSADVAEVISQYEEKALGKSLLEGGNVFIFFDEIQKVQDWESKIKVLYDLHPNIKIFLSGSAGVSLKKKSAESLAGRIMEIQAKPLSFSEFLQWRGIKIETEKPEIYAKTANAALMDYLRKGGFPEIVNEESGEIIRNYAKGSVLEKILYRDIQEEFGVKDLELLKTLLELFVREPGMIVNVDRLSKDLGRSKITVANYIEYLKYGLLIREVKNLRENLLLASRKGKKVYPTSTAFCFALQPDFYSDKKMEKVFEAAVASAISAEHYYRNGFEVDFVEKSPEGEMSPIEVKHGAMESGQVKAFMEKFGAKKGTVVAGTNAPRETGGIRIVPLWLFLMQKS